MDILDYSCFLSTSPSLRPFPNPIRQDACWRRSQRHSAQFLPFCKCLSHVGSMSVALDHEKKHSFICSTKTYKADLMCQRPWSDRKRDSRNVCWINVPTWTQSYLSHDHRNRAESAPPCRSCVCPCSTGTQVCAQTSWREGGPCGDWKTGQGMPSGFPLSSVFIFKVGEVSAQPCLLDDRVALCDTG